MRRVISIKRATVLFVAAAVVWFSGSDADAQSYDAYGRRLYNPNAYNSGHRGDMWQRYQAGESPWFRHSQYNTGGNFIERFNNRFTDLFGEEFARDPYPSCSRRIITHP